jgi:hypothetical protein
MTPVSAHKPSDPCTMSRFSAYTIVAMGVALAIIGILSYQKVLPQSIANASLAAGGALAILAAIINLCSPPKIIDLNPTLEAALKRERSLRLERRGDGWKLGRGLDSATLTRELSAALTGKKQQPALKGEETEDEFMREILSSPGRYDDASPLNGSASGNSGLTPGSGASRSSSNPQSETSSDL